MRLKGGAVGKAALLKNSPGLKTKEVSAPPSGEYGVQSLNIFRFDSMQNPNIVDTFYFNIPLSGYSMPVCALARNENQFWLLWTVFTE